MLRERKIPCIDYRNLGQIITFTKKADKSASPTSLESFEKIKQATKYY